MTIPEQVEVKKEETLAQQKEISKEINQPEVTSQGIPEETEKDINWKKWKENRQREREGAARETEAKIKAQKEAEALRQALEAVVNKASHTQRQENNGYDNEEESEEQRINRKVEEALAKREREYQQQRENEELKSYPSKLNNTYSDFNQVCSPENLDYLEYHHPELAKSFAHRKDGFEKWSDIYNAVKRYIPNVNSNRDAIKAEKNLAKPQSLSHSTLSATGPTGNSYQLTEQRRAENWSRMQKTLKGLS